MEMTDLDVGEVIEGVFTGMLGFELERTHGDHVSTAEQQRFIGTVHISGAWDGSVVVECTDELTRLVAAAMFGSDPADVQDDETIDVIGELANMIGGNIKALIEGESVLSLPTVVRGVDFRVLVPGTHLARSLAYNCEGCVLAVRVLVKNRA
jgi:chemotaxis protein CheX